MSRADFRNHRVFYVGDPIGQTDGWYFEVRDGDPRGPYATRSMAEQALADYLGGANEHNEGSDAS